jgi:hypothetical protein
VFVTSVILLTSFGLAVLTVSFWKKRQSDRMRKRKGSWLDERAPFS